MMNRLKSILGFNKSLIVRDQKKIDIMDKKIHDTSKTYSDIITSFKSTTDSLVKDIKVTMEKDFKANLEMFADQLYSGIVIVWVRDEAFDVNKQVIHSEGAATIDYVNKAFTTMMGYTLEEVQGKKISELFPEGKKEQYRDVIIEFYKRHRNAPHNDRRLNLLELEFVTKGGMPITLEISLSRELEEDGKHYQIVIFRNIDERKMGEDVMRTVATSAQKFVRATDENFKDLLLYMMSRLGGNLRANNVYVFKNTLETRSNHDPMSECFAFWSSNGDMNYISSPVLFCSHWQDKLINGQVINTNSVFLRATIDDCYFDNGNECPTCVLKEFFKDDSSLLLIPILDDEGKWIGTLGVDDHNSKRIWSSTHVEALKTASGLIAAALEKIDLTKRITDEKNNTFGMMASTIDHSSDPIFITSLDGSILHANQALVDRYGYTKIELIGNTPRTFNSNRHTRAFFDRIYEVINRGETWSGTIINKCKDGNFYDEDMTIIPIRNADKGIQYFFNVIKSKGPMEDHLFLGE